MAEEEIATTWIDTAKEMAIEYSPRVFGALLTLIIGFWLAKFVTKRIKILLAKRSVDVSLSSFLGSLISVVIKCLVLLTAATMFGFEVTSFVAILSAVAFAIGMALQGNLSHLAAGVMILLFRPFKVGDFIVTQGYSGTVKEIQIFNTILTTLDNRVIIVPNGTITAGPIENLSANEKRVVPMTFGIGYDDDIDKARKVIIDVAKTCDKIDHELPMDVLVAELADSSVNFTVRPWCKTEHFWDVHFYMQENVKKAFDQNGISIPFPQMDMHMQKVD